MDHLDCPSPELWEERRAWFESVEERVRGAGSYIVSEQACALAADVQATFCAGAWVAVTVLAMSVVDASLREAEAPGFRGDTKQLLHFVGANPSLQELRMRRNRLVHMDCDKSALTVDDRWSSRDALEGEARKAIELMWEAFYIGPWT